LREPFDRHVRTRLRRLRNAGREFRPIFVCGASGSGTSFLALSLGSRFDCAGVVYEMDVQVSESSFLHVPALEAETYPTVADYERAIRPRERWSVEQGRTDLLDLFRSYGSGPSRDIVAKGPDINLVRARFLNRCFPDARFVLIFRDPVANVEGLRRKWPTFGDDSLDESIRFYARTHEAFLDASPELAGRVVGIEYEQLVADSDGALGRLAEHLELLPSRRPARLATAPNVEGMGIRNVRQGRIQVVKDATQRALERLGSEAETIRASLEPVHRRMRTASFTLQLAN